MGVPKLGAWTSPGRFQQRTDPIYQTTNDPADWAEVGPVGIKLVMPFGPADGSERLRQNLALIQRNCLGIPPKLMHHRLSLPSASVDAQSA